MLLDLINRDVEAFVAIELSVLDFTIDDIELFERALE